MSILTVALIQQSCSADRDANITKTAASIRSAKSRGARLVLLQELHTSSYFCQAEDVANFDLAESVPGPSTDVFGVLARELDIVIVTSLFERRAPGLYHNTAVVIERDGSIAGIYRKMHIPDDPGFYEKFYFTPGDLGFNPIQTSVGTLGVLVCWDQWYPEAARLMTLAGADDPHLPDRYRLGSGRYTNRKTAPARRLDDRPAWSCRCQRHTGNSSKPGRL